MKSHKKLNKRERVEHAVKNFLTFHGFIKDDQTAIVKLYFETIVKDFDKTKYPKARTTIEAQTAYLIDNFPPFAAWINEIMTEANG